MAKNIEIWISNAMKQKKVLYSLKHLHTELKRQISGLGKNAPEQRITGPHSEGRGWRAWDARCHPKHSCGPSSTSHPRAALGTGHQHFARLCPEDIDISDPSSSKPHILFSHVNNVFILFKKLKCHVCLKKPLHEDHVCDRVVFKQIASL